MRKLEKAEVVQAIQAKVAKSQIGILTDFKGLKVADMTRLRRQLQDADAELTVVKNTLLRRAGAGESPLAPLLSHVTGPNALTLGYADPVLVTKVLIKFAQEKPQLVIKAGALGGKAFATLTGEVAAVQAAVDAGADVVAKKGLLVNKVVIASPAKALFKDQI